MTAPLKIDYATFGQLQRRAERAGFRLRRFESGGVVRHFVKSRGRSRELLNADDVEALVAQVGCASSSQDARQ